MAKVTDIDVRKIVRDELHDFGTGLGVHYLYNTEQMIGKIKPELMPHQDDLELLLDHLGLEIQSGKRIVKRKKK